MVPESTNVNGEADVDVVDVSIRVEVDDKIDVQLFFSKTFLDDQKIDVHVDIKSR